MILMMMLMHLITLMMMTMKVVASRKNQNQVARLRKMMEVAVVVAVMLVDHQVVVVEAHDRNQDRVDPDQDQGLDRALDQVIPIMMHLQQVKMIN
jgi:hypothetical protein